MKKAHSCKQFRSIGAELTAFLREVIRGKIKIDVS